MFEHLSFPQSCVMLCPEKEMLQAPNLPDFCIQLQRPVKTGSCPWISFYRNFVAALLDSTESVISEYSLGLGEAEHALLLCSLLCWAVRGACPIVQRCPLHMWAVARGVTETEPVLCVSLLRSKLMGCKWPHRHELYCPSLGWTKLP